MTELQFQNLLIQNETRAKKVLENISNEDLILNLTFWLTVLINKGLLHSEKGVCIQDVLNSEH